MSIKEIETLRSNSVTEMDKVIGIINGFAKLPIDQQRDLADVFQNFLNNE